MPTANFEPQKLKLAYLPVKQIAVIVYTTPVNAHTNEFSFTPMQARRHGGHSGAVPLQMTACAPPDENCAPPPSEDCAPKKLTGLGLLECKSGPKLVFATGIFVIFVDPHRIS